MLQQGNATPRTIALPHGFKQITEAAMVFNVKKFKDVLDSRKNTLQRYHGTNTVEKLSCFCLEHIQSGKAVTVTAIGRSAVPNGRGEYSYLCLCPCGGEQETFVLCGSFLSNLNVSSGKKQHPTVPLHGVPTGLVPV